VIGLHLVSIKSKLFRLRWAFLVGTVLFFIAGMVEWELLLRASNQEWVGPRATLIDNIYAGCFLLTFLAFENARLPRLKQMNYLGINSYGIYLVHMPVLEYTARAIYHFAPVILAYQVLFQPILYAAGLGIPLLLMAFVNRTPLRRYYNFLFG
jgi:peptidoglycan/LPS O-acetylase OafA/YrhL